MEQIKWGMRGGSLVKVELVKETQQYYTLKLIKKITGWLFIGKRTHKSEITLFDTPREAVQAMIDFSKELIACHQRDIDNAQERINGYIELAAMLEAAEKEQDHAE